MIIVKALLAVGFLAFAIAFPHLFINPLITQIAVGVLIYATMATAWNILGGFSGYISLGHAAFFGIGAYAFAIICQNENIQGGYGAFWLVPVAGLIAAAFAVPLGIICLRTRRHVFVVLTIAILFVGQLLATNLTQLTAGSNGMLLPLPTWQGGFYNIPFYYAALIIFVVTLLTALWIRKSKLGLGLLSIRDDEDRAVGLGVNTAVFKLIAFVIPAFFIGMVGALNGYFLGQIYPQTVFNPLDDLAMVLMAFTGGLGTVFGPALGAFLLESAHQYFLIQYGSSGYYLILYGSLFLVIILLLPQGIIPSVRQRIQQLEARRQRASEQRAALKEELATGDRGASQ